MLSADSTDRKVNYQKSFAKHGESPEALQWANYRAAALRYRQLVKDVDTKGKTILDAGCGMGDLLPFLYAKDADFTYEGVDVTPEFIDIASKRYSGHSFHVANPFTDLSTQYDIVLSSGVMNTNANNWFEARMSMVEKLWLLTKECLAFNMAGGLGSIDDTTGGKIAYADAQKVIEYCASLTPKIVARTHYHSKDFTITMFR